MNILARFSIVALLIQFSSNLIFSQSWFLRIQIQV